MIENTMRTAIDNCWLVEVTFRSKEKGDIKRKCVPFDIGPGKKTHDKSDRYHFFDLDSPEKSHILSILPSQILELIVLNETFNPGDYVNWLPNWFYKRDWGKYS